MLNTAVQELSDNYLKCVKLNSATPVQTLSTIHGIQLRSQSVKYKENKYKKEYFKNFT